MFVIGTVGCCATLRESKVGLGFFLIVILIIFAAEVTAFVFGFIYRGRIKGDLEKSMNGVFQKYDGANAEAHAVDYLQRQGCEAKLEQVLQDVLSYAMLVILGFAIIKFFGMLSICVITCRSKKNDYQPLYA
ncbi:Tetraspanin-36 [Labeo rohita]|uniref:Tetraspanin-36 n=1 Tax=Labeo rohita TaxID=84645 RepID=A0ABQ8MFC3_LABRO|nr:Tetraspanin-36 [Labeo rohita]